jgi:hypothetical protein
MRLIMLHLLLLYSQLLFSQSEKGIAFQAVARTGMGIIIPGKQIQVRISVLLDTLSDRIVYQELKSIRTNPLGLFTVIIGSSEPGKIITVGDFEKIDWTKSGYFIRVEIDPNNNLQFIRIGQQQIHYVAYAFSADHILAANIEGVLSLQQGGTGVTNLSALKQVLQLDKVNNIPDSAKAISKATTIALNNKLDKKDTASLSSRINQKINKGELTAMDLEASLGFMPFRIDYGAFFDTSRQTATINTATAVRWRDTSNNSHIYISNNSGLEPSRITVAKEGVYFVQFAVQVTNTQIANDEISIWIRRNGAAYPNSLRQFLTGAIGAKNIFSGQAIIPIGEADYLELFFSVRNSQTQLLKTNSLSSPSRPSIPSAQIQLFRIQ